MADAASKIAIALAELHNGGLTPATKQHGGDLVAQLYGLRQYMAGYRDFDAMARALRQ